MANKKKAFITGVTGQDGSYLAELLLEKGYDVVGLDRRCSERDYWRLGETKNKIKIIEGDLMEYESLRRIIEQEQPDEIYNLAAQSHVGASFKTPLIYVPSSMIPAQSLNVVSSQSVFHTFALEAFISVEYLSSFIPIIFFVYVLQPTPVDSPNTMPE